MPETLEKFEYKPDYAVAPGETIEEFISHLGMAKREFATRLGVSAVSLSRILSGEQAITYETADNLELVTGVKASFWNNLESQYRQDLLQIKKRNKNHKELEWLAKIPTKELVARGAIDGSDNKEELLRQVYKFFGVSSLESWNQIWLNAKVAARRSLSFDVKIELAATWLRLGQIQALKVDCNDYNAIAFKKALKKALTLTMLPVDDAVAQIRELFASSGVALSFVKEFKSLAWNGATQWLSPKKAMILLCLRGKSEDKFWFTLFHEAAHILFDSHKEVYINDDESSSEKEKDADKFAADFLIPSRYNEIIVSAESADDIYGIAEKLGISPGIVAGRYQYLTHKWNFYNNLKRRFDWSEQF
jgi:addiction module HigA family antidote